MPSVSFPRPYKFDYQIYYVHVVAPVLCHRERICLINICRVESLHRPRNNTCLTMIQNCNIQSSVI